MNESEREAYRKKVEAQLAEWRAEIEKLRAQADQAEADARIRYHEEIEKLRGYQREAEDQLDRMRAASEGAWDDVRAGMDRAWNEMAEAMRRAYARFD
jgi:F0F1-type ATP synthase membrane subunit b/b'